MEALYMVYISTTRSDGKVQKRVIRHRVRRLDAMRIVEHWARRYADRENVTVGMELEY